MLKIICSGNITDKPELKQTKTGKPYCEFTLAVNRNVKDENRKALFFKCVQWGQQSENIVKYTDKGSIVSVLGAFDDRTYTGQDGTTKHILEINISDIQFNTYKGETNKPNLQPLDDNEPTPFKEQKKQASFDDLDNDIPF